MNFTSKALLNIAFVLLIYAILYFSWIPDPSLSRLSWLPHGMSRWADHNGRLRTAIPFVMLGCLGAGFLYRLKCSWKYWTWFLFFMITLVSIAECVQCYMPHRVFDWLDIVSGAAGGAIGMSPFAFAKIYRFHSVNTYSK